jgi:hypothetical protein
MYVYMETCLHKTANGMSDEAEQSAINGSLD